MAMRISPASKNVRKSVPQQAPTGCSKDDTARLEACAAALSRGSAPALANAELHRAIARARTSLPDPCGEEDLLQHMLGMSALLQLVHLRDKLAPETAQLLPRQNDFEREFALTMERVLRRVSLPLPRLKEIAAEVGDTETQGKLAAILEKLNIIVPIAQKLRDTTTNFAPLSAATGVGSRAYKEAAAIAALFGRPDAARAFTILEPREMAALWPSIDVSQKLPVVTTKIKERLLQKDGTYVTVLKTLTTTTGNEFRLNTALTDRTGAHGRIYPAETDFGKVGEAFIVKVQRTQRKLAGNQDTLDTPLPELLASAAAQAEATARVNAGLAAQAPLFEKENGPLRLFDARAATTAVTHQFVDASGKFYQVMRAMAGDLADVSRALTAEVDVNAGLEPLVARARLTAATQAAVQLAALHKRQGLQDGGMAHLDLKLPNMVFNEQGVVRLIDFDEAKTLSVLGRVRNGSRVGGSLPSPERGSTTNHQQGQALSKPYDVWCLGAAMLDLGAPTFYDESPNGPRAVSALLDRPEALSRNFGTQEWFAVYDMIWQQHIRGSGAMTGVPATPSAQALAKAIKMLRARSATLENMSQDVLEAYVNACYARLSRFIGHRLQADSELTTVLLRLALAPNPKERGSAAKLASALTKLMARQTVAERIEVRQLFGRLAKKTPLTEVR